MRRFEKVKLVFLTGISVLLDVAVKLVVLRRDLLTSNNDTVIRNCAQSMDGENSLIDTLMAFAVKLAGTV